MSCRCQNAREPRPKRTSFLGLMAQVAMLYALLVFGGGTLINTGHPVAEEVGRLFHLVTFVEPAAHWAARHDLDMVANGLFHLSQGFDVGRFV